MLVIPKYGWKEGLATHHEYNVISAEIGHVLLFRGGKECVGGGFLAPGDIPDKLASVRSSPSCQLIHITVACPYESRIMRLERSRDLHLSGLFVFEIKRASTSGRICKG